MFPDNHLAFGEQLLISIYSGDGYSAVRAIWLIVQLRISLHALFTSDILIRTVPINIF
jgi:hypothetical protein